MATINVKRIKSTYDTISRLNREYSRFFGIFLEIVILYIFYSESVMPKEIPIKKWCM